MKTLNKNSTLFILIILTNAVFAQTKTLNEYAGEWEFDTTLSSITFKIGNYYIFKTKGELEFVQGHFKHGDVMEIQTIINVASLKTGIKLRDKHLKTEDFFFVEKYPVIKFSGNNEIVKSEHKKYRYQTKGKLSIRGIQQEETILFNIQQESNKVIILKGEADVNRFDYQVDHKMPGIGKVAKVNFEVRATLMEVE